LLWKSKQIQQKLRETDENLYSGRVRNPQRTSRNAAAEIQMPKKSANQEPEACCWKQWDVG